MESPSACIALVRSTIGFLAESSSGSYYLPLSIGGGVRGVEGGRAGEPIGTQNQGGVRRDVRTSRSEKA